jgi:hypothetical protein
VHVGAIAKRTGNPHGTEPWEWRCGFYPGSNPGDDRHGTAASFDAARAAFEAAWRDYLPKRREADFQEWRDHEACTVEKYRPSIGTSECRPTGALMADRGWKRPFDDPIPLPRGRQLVTLQDAAAYIMKLPKADRDLPEWQAAGEALIMAAEGRGPLMHARIGVMRA